MDWNEEIIAQLKALWAEGHSTAEIGRRMGVTKNAVVGKAHRLTLPPRPSPIRREDGEVRAATPRRVTGPTLPSLSVPDPLPREIQAREPASAPPVVPVPPAVADAPPRPERPAVRPVLRPVAPTPLRRVAACCWPIGEPGTPEFYFCDAEAAQGRPYCAEHVQVAYVKVRERREDAA